MRLEVFNKEKHYEVLSKWWKGYGWEALHPTMLPPTAFVAYEEDKPIAAAFMYITNTTVAFMDWYVGNPEVSSEERGEGLDLIIESLKKIAKVKGCNLIYTISKTTKINKRLVDHGFQNTGEVSELILAM